MPVLSVKWWTASIFTSCLLIAILQTTFKLCGCMNITSCKFEGRGLCSHKEGGVVCKWNFSRANHNYTEDGNQSYICLHSYDPNSCSKLISVDRFPICDQLLLSYDDSSGPINLSLNSSTPANILLKCSPVIADRVSSLTADLCLHPDVQNNLMDLFNKEGSAVISVNVQFESSQTASNASLDSADVDVGIIVGVTVAVGTVVVIALVAMVILKQKHGICRDRPARRVHKLDVVFAKNAANSSPGYAYPPSPNQHENGDVKYKGDLSEPPTELYEEVETRHLKEVKGDKGETKTTASVGSTQATVISLVHENVAEKQRIIRNQNNSNANFPSAQSAQYENVAVRHYDLETRDDDVLVQSSHTDSKYSPENEIYSVEKPIANLSLCQHKKKDHPQDLSHNPNASSKPASADGGVFRLDKTNHDILSEKEEPNVTSIDHPSEVVYHILEKEDEVQDDKIHDNYESFYVNETENYEQIWGQNSGPTSEPDKTNHDILSEKEEPNVTSIDHPSEAVYHILEKEDEVQDDKINDNYESIYMNETENYEQIWGQNSGPTSEPDKTNHDILSQKEEPNVTSIDHPSEAVYHILEKEDEVQDDKIHNNYESFYMNETENYEQIWEQNSGPTSEPDPKHFNNQDSSDAQNLHPDTANKLHSRA